MNVSVASAYCAKFEVLPALRKMLKGIVLEWMKEPTPAAAAVAREVPLT